MISLLDGSEQKMVEKNLRSLYLERLQEIAEDSQLENIDSRTETVEAEACVTATPAQVKSEKFMPETREQESAQALDHDEFRKVAEQIAPKCVEALTEAMRGMHRLVVADRGESEGAISRLLGLSEDVRLLDGEISSLRESAEFLTEAERGLSAKVAGLETRFSESAEATRQISAELQGLTSAQAQDRKSQALANSAVEERLSRLENSFSERLNALEKQMTTSLETASLTGEHLEAIAQSLATHTGTHAGLSAALSCLEETQRALQQRLDKQAEVIRNLYASEQERGTQLHTALERVKEITAGFFMPAPLPEAL